MAVDKQTLGAAIAVCGSGGGGSVGAYTFKGSVATYDDLPALGNEVGDIYDVRDTGANYAWTGTAWDALGQIVDVQALEDEIDGKVDKVTELLINEIVPNATQSATFDASTGNLSTVTHTRNSVAIRTDVYTYGANTITEVRTLNTGESITITTNTTTNTTIVA